MVLDLEEERRVKTWADIARQIGVKFDRIAGTKDTEQFRAWVVRERAKKQKYLEFTETIDEIVRQAQEESPLDKMKESLW